MGGKIYQNWSEGWGVFKIDGSHLRTHLSLSWPVNWFHGHPTATWLVGWPLVQCLCVGKWMCECVCVCGGGRERKKAEIVRWSSRDYEVLSRPIGWLQGQLIARQVNCGASWLQGLQLSGQLIARPVDCKASLQPCVCLFVWSPAYSRGWCWRGSMYVWRGREKEKKIQRERDKIPTVDRKAWNSSACFELCNYLSFLCCLSPRIS